MLYFDHAASSPIEDEALKILYSSMKSDYANPSASHKLGKDLFKKVEKSRAFFLSLLDKKGRGDFIFTGSATESNNTVVNGIQFSCGDDILYFSGDHPSIIAPVTNLKNKDLKIYNFSLSKELLIEKESFWPFLDSNIKLICLSHTNNQNGLIITELSSLISFLREKFRGVHIHIDAVQSFCKIDISGLAELADSISISSHKIAGPKGIAGLWFKKDSLKTPLLFGGGQENCWRSSTVAAPLVFSFREAAEILEGKRIDSYTKVKELHLFLKRALLDLDMEVLFPFNFESLNPYIMTFIIPNISSDILLRHLEEKEVYLSSSSACSSKVKGDNPSFLALGIKSNYHKNVLRFSFSSHTTMQEVQEFLKIFENILNELSSFMK